MFPHNDFACTHPEMPSIQDLESIARACDDLGLALYRGNYDKTSKLLKIQWVTKNLHQRIGDFAHQSDDYLEIIDRNIHPDDISLAHDLGGVLTTKKAFVRQYRLLSSENFYRTFSEYVSVLGEDQDNVHFVGAILMVACGEYCSVFDSVSEQRVRSKFASSDGIFGWHRHDGNIHCSSSLDQLLDIGDEVAHINLRDFIRQVDPEDRRLCFIALDDVFRRNNKTFSINVRIKRRTGSVGVCISGIVVDFSRYFEPTVIVGNVVKLPTKSKDLKSQTLDLERNRKTEFRLRELKNKLFLIKKTEKQLLENLRKERELNKAKSLFINMVSHEMRTPLAIIQGAADLLETQGDRFNEKDRNDYLHSIKKAILRMTHTMDAVLILGKVQNNQLSFQPIKSDVVKFCANIINEIRSLNEGRQIILQISKAFPREIQIDTTLLYHIVSNLLSNAIKYSDDDKEVILKLEMGRGAQDLRIYVQDFGIGIREEERDLIFNLFQRGSNIANKKGIGIGMFVVKHCIHLHGGSIEVYSKEGEGTTFRVILPILK